MKAKLLLSGLTLISMQAFSQSTNCEDLLEENASLRKALAITKPEKTITASGINFNLIKCVGNKKDQTVTVHLTLVNKEPNRNFQFSNAKIIDIEGNEYKSSSINIGSDGVRSKLFTDTPVKAILEFSKVLPSTRIIKLIDFVYYDDKHLGKNLDFQFKDLDIKWE